MSEADRVYYDGGCGLCHRAVRFLAARDREGAFRFAPLGGETFLRTLSSEARRDLPDSLVVQTAEGRILVRAAAVAHLLGRLGGGWRLLGILCGVLPRPLCDWGYEAVARNRKHMFRPPGETCPLPASTQRSRFDP